MDQPHVELNPPRTETGTAAWDPPSLHGEMKRKGRKKNGSAVAELIRWPDGESHGLYKRTPTSSSTPRIEPNRAGAETITRETNNSSRAVPCRLAHRLVVPSSPPHPHPCPSFAPPVPRSDRRRLIWTAGRGSPSTRSRGGFFFFSFPFFFSRLGSALVIWIGV
jgi:hypothetical protein